MTKEELSANVGNNSNPANVDTACEDAPIDVPVCETKEPQYCLPKFYPRDQRKMVSQATVATLDPKDQEEQDSRIRSLLNSQLMEAMLNQTPVALSPQSAEKLRELGVPSRLFTCHIKAQPPFVYRPIPVEQDGLYRKSIQAAFALLPAEYLHTDQWKACASEHYDPACAIPFVKKNSPKSSTATTVSRHIPKPQTEAATAAAAAANSERKSTPKQTNKLSKDGRTKKKESRPKSKAKNRRK